MNDVKENLTKVAESLAKISDDNNARDRKLDDFIKDLYTGLMSATRGQTRKLTGWKVKLTQKSKKSSQAWIQGLVQKEEVQRELDTDALTTHKADTTCAELHCLLGSTLLDELSIASALCYPSLRYISLNLRGPSVAQHAS